MLFALGNPVKCLPQQTESESLPGYHVQHFTDENGLPQNSVKGIVRDERGNIWLATERGLVRYDGRTFAEFNEFGNSFASRNIYGFYHHPSNRKPGILALTHNENWVRIANGDAQIDTTFKHLPYYNPLRQQGNRIKLTVEALPSLIKHIFVGRTALIDPIFPYSDGKHYAYEQGQVRLYSQKKLEKSFQFTAKDYHRFFTQDQDLYYLDEHLKLFRFGSADHDLKPEQVAIGGDIAVGSATNQASSFEIFWNNTSGQAFVQRKDKLYYLTRSKSGSLSSKLLLKGFDFESNAIKSLYYDMPTGRLFLGSVTNGLYIIEEKPFLAVNLAGAKDDVYYGQTLFDSNTVLTTEGHTATLDQHTDAILTGTLDTIGKLTGWDQYSILKSKKGDIWTKQGEILLRLDSSGKHLKNKWSVKGGITQLYEEKNGRIWIGTTFEGLHFIDPSTANPRPVRFPMTRLLNISWIQHQSPTVLWIGTGSGLYRLDLNTRKVSYIKGLEDIYVRSLYLPGQQNEIWITTYTNGFYLLKEGKLTKFPLDKRYHLANAHCIFEDKNGYFWVTTNKGLFQIKRSDLLAYSKAPFELYYQYYSKSAGFNTNEFNGDLAYRVDYHNCSPDPHSPRPNAQRSA
jgi:hypothetical protein